MDTKTDRNALCFDKKFIPYNILNLHFKKETPLYQSKSQGRGHSCLFLGEGSLTVEAAFGSTAFLLVLFSLLMLFQMLADFHMVQMRLANTVWQYETLGTKLATLEGFVADSVLIQWDEEKGICFVKRWEKIPFIGGSFFGISFYQQMKINPYTGQSMVSEEEAEYVYITKNGEVYHRERECVYLNPNVQSVKFARVSKLRNYSGSRYNKCASCCGEKEFMESMLVYLTPYGEHFHSDRTCSGLKRSIRKVKIENIGDMPPCSKCIGNTKERDG